MADDGDVEGVDEPVRVWSDQSFALKALGSLVAVAVAIAFFGNLVVNHAFDWEWGAEAEHLHGLKEDRAALEAVVSFAFAEGDPEDYYTSLPPDLAGYSASGLISVHEDRVFIPLWSGIPDDAGGYWYSPSGSPHGWDMWGARCTNAVQIDGPWWACGMSEEWLESETDGG